MFKKEKEKTPAALSKNLPAEKEIPPREGKEKKESKAAGRKTIVFLFVFSLILSIFFYFQPKARIWLRQLNFSLGKIQLVSFSTKTGGQRVVRWFRQETESLPGQWSFWVVDLETRTGFGEKEEVRFPTVIAGYRLIDDGKAVLTEKAQLLQTDKRIGLGELKSQSVGINHSLGELLSLAVSDQDETAAAVVSRAWQVPLKEAKQRFGLERWETARQSPVETSLLWVGLKTESWLGETTKGLLASNLFQACQKVDLAWGKAVPAGCQFDFGMAHHHGIFLLDGTAPKLIVLMSAGTSLADFEALATQLVEQIEILQTE